MANGMAVVAWLLLIVLPRQRWVTGLLAPVSTLLRWLFQSGAAPIKVAVAAATLATTAALVVVTPGAQHSVRQPLRARVRLACP